MIKTGLCFLIAALLCTTNVLYAASDTFLVRMQVGADLVPPSTPSLLGAVPVAQTQIDLSWTTATDDVLLGGYQVFRDAVQIATTTLTTYSDSGLSANTLYSYFVRSFDSANNFSSSSNSIATSTLAQVPTTTPPVVTNSSSGVPQKLQLGSFTAESQIDSVMLSWTTSRYARFELRWGRTSSYEQGFVVNDVYKKDHQTTITDLEPGTTYEFQLIGYDSSNQKVILKQGTFMTLQQTDTTAPTNVSGLTAKVTGNNVLLNWVNPADADFSHIRIVRSYLFYPSDQNDGYIVYDGADSSHNDTNAFSDYDILFYTVFSYDHKGNISSGAVVGVSKRTSSSITPDFVATTTESEPELDQGGFTIGAIEFVQNGTQVPTIDVDSETPLTIRIPYSALPEHLKTILVTFTHPQDASATFSFLLKVNKDKTFYEAMIAPLQSTGIYPFVVSFYDYQAQKLFTVRGAITVLQKPPLFVQGEKVFSQFSPIGVGILCMLVVCLFLFFWLFMKRRTDDDEEV